MHDWSANNVDWDGINGAARFIGQWLRTWARMSVGDYKEKFGTVRVYCHFGWSTLYSIYRPGYMWIPTWWPYKLDLWFSYNTPFLKILNSIAVPIQKNLYVWRYKKAVQKWPHLYDEIVTCADYGELFEGTIPGYKHGDYWQEVK